MKKKQSLARISIKNNPNAAGQLLNHSADAHIHWASKVGSAPLNRECLGDTHQERYSWQCPSQPKSRQTFVNQCPFFFVVLRLLPVMASKTP
mmetsp:Transcript_38596/g.70190  ORF Transcript_38596/g.70190 Transcript_38596/m.70190 type:complete len:92 (-) Transcript_38596:1027-1302(-)